MNEMNAWTNTKGRISSILGANWRPCSQPRFEVLDTYSELRLPSNEAEREEVGWSDESIHSKDLRARNSTFIEKHWDQGEETW